jgi:hypothetical protein
MAFHERLACGLLSHRPHFILSAVDVGSVVLEHAIFFPCSCHVVETAYLLSVACFREQSERCVSFYYELMLILQYTDFNCFVFSQRKRKLEVQNGFPCKKLFPEDKTAMLR